MKQFLTILALACSINMLSAQLYWTEKIEKKLADIEAGDTYEVDNIDNVVWVHDSTYFYDGQATDWVLEQKFKVETRDQYHNTILGFSYDVDDNGDEIITSSYAREFYDEEQLKELHYRQWNETAQQFVDSLRYYHFNEFGGRTNLTIKFWDESNGYYNGGIKRLATFDSEGKELTNNWFNYDGDDWINSVKREYAYDADGNLETLTQWEWDEEANVWLADERVTYTYDSQDLVLTESVDVYDDALGDFKDFLEVTYTYVDNLSEELWMLYSSGSWREYKYITYSYDASDNLVEEIEQNWDSNLEMLVNDKKETRTWNSNNDELVFTEYNWDEILQDFFAITVTTREYDTDFNLIERRKETAETPTQAAINIWKRTYFVSAITVGVNDLGGIEMSVSPNPVRDILTVNSTPDIQIETIEVYNIQGKKVLSRAGHIDSIDLQSLNSGTYFIQVNTNKGNTVKQIVKQ